MHPDSRQYPCLQAIEIYGEKSRSYFHNLQQSLHFVSSFVLMNLLRMAHWVCNACTAYSHAIIQIYEYQVSFEEAFACHLRAAPPE